ncbi:hypothetical protein SLA2020_176900 [Shorea laevis]
MKIRLHVLDLVKICGLSYLKLKKWTYYQVLSCVVLQNQYQMVSEFTAQLQIPELLDNAIFTAGYKAVLHIHSVVEECEIVEQLQQIDPKTRNPWKRKFYLLRMVLLLLAAFRFTSCLFTLFEIPKCLSLTFEVI